jgi:uncharacterized protein YqhQ
MTPEELSAALTEEPAPEAGGVRLGGMALRNGLLVHGPDHWAVALRTRDGRIKVASGRKPRVRGALSQLPGVRGLARLGEAFALLPVVKRRVPDVQLPFEDVKVLGAMVSSSVLSAALRRAGRRGAGDELMVAVLGLAPTALALRDSELAAYHGVEHKAIAAYEQGSDDVAAVPKEHDRCGSNLIVPMMLLSAGGTLLLERIVESPSPAARAGVGLGGASLAVEMFAWSDRHHGEPLAEAFHTPGREIQRLVATKEPTPEQIEVGVAALEEILRAEAA